MRSATMPLLYSWNWSSKRSHRLRWNVSPLFRPHLTARQIQIIYICVSEWGDWVLCLWVCRSRKKWIYSFVFFGARVIHSLDAAGPGVHPHTWREKREFELHEYGNHNTPIPSLISVVTDAVYMLREKKTWSEGHQLIEATRVLQ